MIRRVDLTGDYHATIYSAARGSLAEGADPAGTIETLRNGKLSMPGVIGECAKWTVKETGKRGLHLVPWRPFPAHPVRSRTAETEIDEALAVLDVWGCLRIKIAGRST